MTNSNFSNYSISISQINKYLDCRQAHHFRYRLKVVQDHVAPQLVIGNAVHHGLEKLGLAAKAGQDLTADLLEQAVEDSWNYAQENGVLNAQDEVQTGIESGFRSLQDMLMDGHEVLAVEEPFEGGYGTWTARGVIDLITRVEGELYILDWKTKKTMPTPTEDAIDPQTALYAWHAMTKYGVEEATAGRIYVRAFVPDIRCTKKGPVSLTSKTTYQAYKRFIKRIPSAAIDDEKALARFGKGYRADTRYVARDYCEAVLAHCERVALEIKEERKPLCNFRPSFCPRFCEFHDICAASLLTGETTIDIEDVEIELA